MTIRFASVSLRGTGDRPIGVGLAGQRFDEVEVRLDQRDYANELVHAWLRELRPRCGALDVIVAVPLVCPGCNRFSVGGKTCGECERKIATPVEPAEVHGESVRRDVNVRLEAEKRPGGTWSFRIFDRDGKLVSDRYGHPGPDFEAGRSFERLVRRWRDER